MVKDSCIWKDWFTASFALQVPEIREEIVRANEGKWAKIAKKQMKTFFNPNKVDLRSQARRYVNNCVQFVQKNWSF